MNFDVANRRTADAVLNTFKTSTDVWYQAKGSDARTKLGRVMLFETHYAFADQNGHEYRKPGKTFGIDKATFDAVGVKASDFLIVLEDEKESRFQVHSNPPFSTLGAKALYLIHTTQVPHETGRTP